MQTRTKTRKRSRKPTICHFEIMKIGLIDVDGHNFPNFALMKISAYHKAHGDFVELARPRDLFGVYEYDKIYA